MSVTYSEFFGDLYLIALDCFYLILACLIAYLPFISYEKKRLLQLITFECFQIMFIGKGWLQLLSFSIIKTIIYAIFKIEEDNCARHNVLH